MCRSIAINKEANKDTTPLGIAMNKNKNRMKLKTIYQLSIFLLAWALLPSCTKEDRSDCLPSMVDIEMSFKLAVSTEAGNDIDLSDVNFLEVFLFHTETGLFYKSFQDEQPQLADENYRMLISAAPGTYDILAWGNTNSADYAYAPTEFVENVSTLAEASVWLQLQNSSRAQTEINHSLTHLFYGQHLDCAIEPTDTILEIPADIVQNTYTFDVHMTHRPVAGKPLSVVIDGDHNGYDFLNQKQSELNFIYRKETTPSGPELKQQYAELRTLRLDNDSRVRFKVYSWEGEEMLNESLLELLQNAATNGGFRLDLSKKHSFRMDLNFGETEADISITIDGWSAFEEDSNLHPQS